MYDASAGLEGGKRARGGVRMGWRRLVVKESWERLPWGELGLRKPHWVRWKAGQWLPVLRELAADRPVWRALVRGVVGSRSSSALNGRRGGRVPT